MAMKLAVTIHNRFCSPNNLSMAGW